MVQCFVFVFKKSDSCLASIRVRLDVMFQLRDNIYIYMYIWLKAQDFSFQTDQAALPSGPPLAEDWLASLVRVHRCDCAAPCWSRCSALLRLGAWRPEQVIDCCAPSERERPVRRKLRATLILLILLEFRPPLE